MNKISFIKLIVSIMIQGPVAESDSEEEESPDDLISAAKDLLLKTVNKNDLGSVHSTRSIASIMSRAIKKEGSDGVVINEVRKEQSTVNIDHN